MEEDFTNLTTDRRVNTDLSVMVVVRHAESVANTQGIFQGQSYDTDLSDLGLKQAKALAKRLTGRGVTKLYSSPLKRTYQTALEISKLSGQIILVDDRLIETNHGEWEGKNKNWIMENYTDLYNLWMTHPSQVKFPGGEHFAETAQRVVHFLQTEALIPGTVVVTHDNIVRILMAIANGEHIDEMWSHTLESASVTLFETNVIDGKNILKPLKENDSSHLEGLHANTAFHAL